MAKPMPPRPMKPTVSFIGVFSFLIAEAALAGSLVRRPQPIWILGRSVEAIGRLEALELALGGRPRGPGEQAGHLLFRQWPESFDRLQVLLEDPQTVNAGDDGRGRQSHRV